MKKIRDKSYYKVKEERGRRYNTFLYYADRIINNFYPSSNQGYSTVDQETIMMSETLDVISEIEEIKKRVDADRIKLLKIMKYTLNPMQMQIIYSCVLAPVRQQQIKVAEWFGVSQPAIIKHLRRIEAILINESNNYKQSREFLFWLKCCYLEKKRIKGNVTGYKIYKHRVGKLFKTIEVYAQIVDVFAKIKNIENVKKLYYKLRETRLEQMLQQELN